MVTVSCHFQPFRLAEPSRCARQAFRAGRRPGVPTAATAVEATLPDPLGVTPVRYSPHLYGIEGAAPVCISVECLVGYPRATGA